VIGDPGSEVCDSRKNDGISCHRPDRAKTMQDLIKLTKKYFGDERPEGVRMFNSGLGVDGFVDVDSEVTRADVGGRGRADIPD
jgi:hypothetical protein